MPSLFVFRGHDQGLRFELDAPSTTIGRDSDNSLQLHDHEVSRRHAIISNADGVCTVTDQRSSNGTFINGRQITAQELRTGDEVQMGGTLMLFTGATVEPPGAANTNVDIVPSAAQDDRSRIVRSIAPEEQSPLFNLGADAAGSPWLARARSNLQIMYRTALAVSHTLDIDQLLDRIMQLIFEWVEADRGVIMLVDPETRQLAPRVRHNRPGVKIDERMAISRTILDHVMQTREGVLTSDAQDDARWKAAQSVVRFGVREAICVPMQGRYETVGAIYIDTSSSVQQLMSQGGSRFSDEHLKLMVAIAHQAALAVEDTHYYSAMLQAERLAAMGQTIATLSHHIKNILQGIRGGSYLIKEGLSNNNQEMLRRGWEFVEKNQERISSLVMDMLTFSKEREPELIVGDLNRTVGEVVELAQNRAGERSVECTFTPAADVPQFTFDPEGVHRAVLNIVSNAIDACDPATCEKPDHAGHVKVSTQYDASAHIARVIIEDNGVGIPAEDVDNIFTLFTSSKGSRGTGLGLPVSQKIMREHGGRIYVESAEDQGSRFVCELPCQVASPLHPTELMPVDDPHEKTL
ncbi:MAG: FHA domain-containing protein [Planctomycetes bacterium]|nr:FHA domain-containing protein [Planctomycetota bacterium]